MKTPKKPTWKRVFTIILIVIVAFCATSMVATKFIYDAIFVRYDGTPVEVPQQLEEMVAGRESSNFMSGDNELTGWLYRCEGGNDNLVLIAPGYFSFQKKDTLPVEGYLSGQFFMDDEATLRLVLAPGKHPLFEGRSELVLKRYFIADDNCPFFRVRID